MADTDVVGWVTLGYARTSWPDAVKMTEPVLSDLLTTSHEALVEYLPADALDPAPAVVPHRWRRAQVAHARDLWSAMRVNGSGVIGPEGDVLTITAQPLAAHVKALLRPGAGLPGVL